MGCQCLLQKTVLGESNCSGVTQVGSSSFPRETIHITGIQVYAPTSNAEEAEAERFYEDLQDF